MTLSAPTTMSISTNLALSNKTTKIQASNLTLMLAQHDLNTQRIGMASRDPKNGLLTVKTIPLPVNEALQDIHTILQQKEAVMKKHDLVSGSSANVAHSSLIAKTTISLHTNDLDLAAQQRQIASQIQPVINVMFNNRIAAFADTPVATVETPNAKTTSIIIDKPVELSRPVAFIAALMETKEDCLRTQAVLDEHGDDLSLPNQLFHSAKERIVSILPEGDKNSIGALEIISCLPARLAKPEALVAA